MEQQKFAYTEKITKWKKIAGKEPKVDKTVARLKPYHKA